MAFIPPIIKSHFKPFNRSINAPHDLNKEIAANMETKNGNMFNATSKPLLAPSTKDSKA